jgi:hypothetical protein
VLEAVFYRLKMASDARHQALKKVCEFLRQRQTLREQVVTSGKVDQEINVAIDPLFLTSRITGVRPPLRVDAIRIAPKWARNIVRLA